MDNRLFWARVAAVLICGYGLLGRGFAYIGIPSLKLFVGDVALALFLVFCTGAVVYPWLANLLRPMPLSGLLWSLMLFQLYGVLELARGIAFGNSPVAAVEDFVFNVYPLYFFLGLWVSLAYKDLLGGIIRLLTWVGCLWCLAYYLFLKNVTFTFPGTNAALISSPGGPGICLPGMTYLDLRRWWPIVILSIFFVLAGQERSMWLAVSAALTLQAILTGKVKPLLWSAACVAILLVIGFWTDFAIPSPAGRGGSISSREIIARAVAAVDRDAAVEYSHKNAAMYAGTISWRETWWRAIWSSVHADTETTLLGHGYGFPLNHLVAYLRDDDSLRTPHNIFFYALAYTGWIGVFLFFGFQAILAIVLWRTWRATGQPFGIVLWLMAIIAAMFGSGFETPFGAIPFYLMIGMTVADLVRSPVNEPVAATQQLVPATQW